MTTDTIRYATDYAAALALADDRLETARAAVAAARVPAGDIDTGDEPVTMSGWYPQRTLSGRPAWRYVWWTAGQLHADEPTYDRAAHDELAAAGRAQYDAQRAYDDHRTPSSR